MHTYAHARQRHIRITVTNHPFLHQRIHRAPRIPQEHADGAMHARPVVADRVREPDLSSPRHDAQAAVADVQGGGPKRDVVAQVGPGPAARRGGGEVDGEVGEHGDGEGAGFVGEFERCGSGELWVDGDDVRGEEFVDCGRVAVGEGGGFGVSGCGFVEVGIWGEAGIGIGWGIDGRDATYRTTSSSWKIPMALKQS